MADRLLTINIRRYLVTQPRPKRARKAAKYIRDRVAHYTKLKPENVRLGQELNMLIFKHYSKSMVPMKLRVKIGTDTADVLPFSEEAAKKPDDTKAATKEKKGLFSIQKKETQKPQAPPQTQPKQEKK